MDLREVCAAGSEERMVFSFFELIKVGKGATNPFMFTLLISKIDLRISLYIYGIEL